jgi:hypothetical protein
MTAAGGTQCQSSVTRRQLQVYYLNWTMQEADRSVVCWGTMLQSRKAAGSIPYEVFEFT